MKLNNLIKLNKKKLRPGRGIGSGKGKLQEEAIRVKSQGLELQLKVLKAVKCHYLEDYLNEDLSL